MLTIWLEIDGSDLHDESLQDVLLSSESVPVEVLEPLFHVRIRVPPAKDVGLEAGAGGVTAVTTHPLIHVICEYI